MGAISLDFNVVCLVLVIISVSLHQLVAAEDFGVRLHLFSYSVGALVANENSQKAEIAQIPIYFFGWLDRPFSQNMPSAV